MSENLESKIIGDSNVIEIPFDIITGTPIDLTSIKLLPIGTWLVWANIYFNCSIGQTLVAAWLNKDISNNFPAEGFSRNQIQGFPLGACGISVPMQIYHITEPTAIYLTGYSNFTEGTVTMSGGIYARIMS